MADPTTIINTAVTLPAGAATGFDWDHYKHYIGTVAATLTTISFVPQVVQTIKTRDTKAISLVMYIIFTVGIALWFTYGLLLGSWPMIVSNVITLSLSLIILSMKLRLG